MTIHNPIILVKRFLSLIDSVVPASPDDGTKEWESVTKEAKAIRRELIKKQKSKVQPNERIV